MIKIEITRYIPWKKEIPEFVNTLVERLYDHLPAKFSAKMDERIKAIVLGDMPPYMREMWEYTTMRTIRFIFLLDYYMSEILKK